MAATAGRPAPAEKEGPVAKPAREPLVTQAYESIKEKIITLYFLPGQYLNEGAISSILGLGRTPVHQALQRLHVEGLVEVMPRKGVIVQPDSISEIIKILESRLTVEPELARKAAELATPEEASELKRLAIATPVRDGPPDIDAFTIDDRAFHRRVGELSGNGVMGEFARMLHERSTRYWYLHLWQTLDIARSNRQHAAVAAAISRRDGEAAAAAMREHIVALKTTLEGLQVSSSRRLSAGPRARAGRNGGRLPE